MQTLTAPGALATKRRHDEAELLLELRLTGLTLRLSDHYIPSAPGPDITEVFQIVSNSGFDSDRGDWTDAGSTSGGIVWVSDGAGGGYLLLSTAGGGGTFVQGKQLRAVAVGEVITIKYDIVALFGFATSVPVRIGSTDGGAEYVSAFRGNGHFVETIVCTSTVLSIAFRVNGNGLGASSATVDNVTAEVARRRGTTTVPEALPLVASWGTLTEAMNILDAGGSPNTAEVGLLNTKPIAGRARLSDLIRTSGNPTGYEFAFAELVILRRDPGGAGLETVLGVFYLEEPTEIGDRILRLRMTDESLALDQTRSATTIITRDLFRDCDPDAEGQAIPVPIGSLSGVPCPAIKAGRATTLDGAIDETVTTLTLTDSTDFLSGDTVQIDQEQILLGTKLGRTFSGCTRAVGGTAGSHDDDTAVMPLRGEFIFAVGECTPDYPLGAITNVKVGGVPVRTAVTTELAANLFDDGTERRFGVIRFTPADITAFHLGGAGSPITIVVASINVTDPATSAIRTIPIPATFEAATPTTRTLRLTIPVSGGSPGWNVARRLTSGTWVTIASGASTDLPFTVTDTRTYDSLGDEQVRLTITSGSGYNVTLQFTEYTVETGSRGAGGGGSAASAVIGDVTCDVVGIVDSRPHTITPSDGALIENFADATRFLLVKRYGARRALGSSWGLTRLRVSGESWAFLFGDDGPVPFDEFRQLVERQSRCRLFLDGDRWEFVYLDDHSTPAVTLDYQQDIWKDTVTLARTERTRVFNSLIVKSQRHPGTGAFARTKRQEAPGLAVRARQEETLDLPWVQTVATADMLAAYWLARKRQQWWTVSLVAYQNVLALMKADTFRLVNHPILAAHGEPVFRITGKDYRLSDEHSGRIALTAIEVPA